MSSNGKSREILQKRPSTHASVLDEVASRLTSTMWQLLVAVVALVALSAWAWTTVDANLARQVRSQLQTQVGSSREALDLWTAGLLDALVRASSSERVSAAFAMEGASSLPPTFAAELGGAAYLLTDRSGRTLHSSPGLHGIERLPLPETELEAWLAAPSARVWTPAYYGTQDGEARPLLTFSVPVTRADVRLGALHLLVDPAERLSEILSLARPATSGETYAFDRQGRMISRSRFRDQLVGVGLLDADAPSSILAVDLRDPGVSLPDGGRAALPRAQQPLTEAVRAALRGEAGSNVTGYADYRGVPVVGAWDFDADVGLGLVSELDVDEAFELRVALSRLLAMLFGLLGLAVVGSVWSGHRRRDLQARAERAESKAARLGQYTLVRKLGEGGMGTVYEATHQLLQRPTAVKLIKAPAEGEPSRERFARFEREVQLTAQLTHPNTIAVYDFGKTKEGTFYYAMEYVDGIDLELLVERHGAVPAARAVHLITQACGSLHEAHSRGLIHRDVKPSNIMVCERGGEHDRVKVLDFGLVKSVTPNPADPTITADGRLAGTPHYMAPECLSNPEDAGVASDVYALGAVLYFLIAGRDLFPQRDTVAVIVAQMTLEPEPLESVAPTVPPALARVIHSCLCKDPQQRPRTAKQLAQRLRETIPSDAWDAERAAVWWADPSRAA